MTPAALSVWWDGAVVGALRVDEHGQLSFQYAPDWLADPVRPSLSMSLPKRGEPFKQRECRPFFAGLLPEEGQLEAVARVLGVSTKNDFTLLEHLGGDVAGALTLWPEGEEPAAGRGDRPVQPLDEEKLAAILERLPSRPLLAGEDGLRLSLAGAQAKLPVVIVDGRIALPAAGQPTTHIVKPAVQRFGDTVENEALMMALARAAGLPVAATEIRTAMGHSFLLISRYDRRSDDHGHIRRLHQEDFCQAMGLPPERKYQIEGGPTFRECFNLLRRSATTPAIDVLKLLDVAIFNAVIGNADAHGKNFSLLYDGSSVALAPFYDLLSTAAYPELSKTFAMKIGKRGTLEEIGRSAWTQFAQESGVAAPFIVRRVEELTRVMRALAPQVADTLGNTPERVEILRRLVSIVVTRAERISSML